MLLLCSVSAVAAHYSAITTGDCEGNARLYTANGAETMNWNFYPDDYRGIDTDGWRKLVVNPSGWGNPNAVASWDSVPTHVQLNREIQCL